MPAASDSAPSSFATRASPFAALLRLEGPLTVERALERSLNVF